MEKILSSFTQHQLTKGDGNWCSITILAHHLITYLTLSSLQNNAYTFANGVDPDETARNEPSHLDLHCFAILLLIFWLKSLFATMDATKFRYGRVHFINSAVKGLIIFSSSTVTVVFRSYGPNRWIAGSFFGICWFSSFSTGSVFDICWFSSSIFYSLLLLQHCHNSFNPEFPDMDSSISEFGHIQCCK